MWDDCTEQFHEWLQSHGLVDDDTCVDSAADITPRHGGQDTCAFDDAGGDQLLHVGVPIDGKHSPLPADGHDAG